MDDNDLNFKSEEDTTIAENIANKVDKDVNIANKVDEDVNIANKAMVCGVFALVISIVGGITYGVIGAGVGTILSAVGIVLSINASKKTNHQKGAGALICSVFGFVICIIFAAGCAICGASEMESVGTKGYTCYGIVGGSCMVADDVEEVNEKLEEFFAN